MTVHPGPTPWQAVVITYPSPNNHTHTPGNAGGETSVETSSTNTYVSRAPTTPSTRCKK